MTEPDRALPVVARSGGAPDATLRRAVVTVTRLVAGAMLALVTVTACSNTPSRSERMFEQLEAANVCTSGRPQKDSSAIAGAPLSGAWVCAVNPLHDLTVWASPSKRRTHTVVRAVRRMVPASCLPLPRGVSRGDVNTNLRMVVGSRFIASTDVPEALSQAHVVLGGRIVDLGTLIICS